MAWEPDYATDAELRSYATRSSVTVDDAYLGLAISAGSRAVDRHCRRQFGLVAAPEARYYWPRWSRRLGWVVDIDDLMTTVGLVVTGTYTLYPRNAAARGRPWTSMVFDSEPDCEVEVTARWGWTSVPVPVKQATLLQASRLFARRGAPFGIAGSPDAGSEMRLLAKVDPDVAVSLKSYMRKARPL